MSGHPLDRPVWNAFTGRQAMLARRHGAALRVDPAIGLFAAAADRSPAALADLLPLVDAGGLALVEPADEPTVDPAGAAPALPPGLAVARAAPCHQMVVETLASSPPAFAFAPLGADDEAAMLALATLTGPGPFRIGTRAFGGFIGVKQDGRLVAMAGQRMQPDGFTEVSGVCTHPDHRGRGLAAGLMHAVAARILARGERPFLHVYSANRPAIALYEKLGYRLRRTMMLTTIVADPAAVATADPIAAGRAAPAA